MLMKLSAAVLATILLSPFAAIAEEDSQWYDKVHLGMDFRYRHEMQDAEEDTVAPRHRHRIRARFNVNGQVDENVKLYLRLMTGSSSERSTIASGNETLDDGFSNDPFWVDMAYAEWMPCEDSTIHLGKFATPFYRPSKSQLIWDGDLTPEGFAYMYHRDTDAASYFLNLAATWLDENHAANNTGDQGIVGAQLGAEIAMGDPSLVVAIGNYNFANLKDSPTLDGGSSGSGNSTYTNTTERYLYDFNLLEGILELKTKVGGMSSSVYVNYVQNQDPSDDNDAYIAGFKIGKVKAKGDWAFGYSYRDVKKDAVVARLADSDFTDGKTDVKGHTLSISYGIFKNSDISLAYFDAERNVSTTKKDYQRAHLDFSFKF